MLINDIGQLMRRLHARLPPYDLAILEKNERGYTRNLHLRSQRLVAIYVDLNDRSFFADLTGYLSQNGRHRFAGAAPLRTEVY